MYDTPILEATMKAVLRDSTRINFSIDKDRLAALVRLSEKKGAPMSELIRRAIDLYLKKET
jgi:hypothetical protein